MNDSQMLPNGQGFRSAKCLGYFGERSEPDLERRSAAVTLSDLELFVFPELLYALVLANIMSPCIWRWRNDPWFKDIASMTPYRRIVRLKQYVVQNYAFNLDLHTWGMTTKQRELARFRPYMGEGALKRSSPFFGYDGDRYYYDLDIRSQFGLDPNAPDAIPYWKTETVEAMNAFRHKPGHAVGAGECVSLAALYAAALFIVARIPLEDIYLMITPLHCQGFIDLGDGILTNNRRIITKRMWFNGSPLSSRARRALENERLTFIAHESGWVHTAHDHSTMDEAAFLRISDRLESYLASPLTDELLGNFLRGRLELQPHFQLRWQQKDAEYYIALERAMAQESHGSYRVTDGTRNKLLATLDSSEIQTSPIPGRVVLNDLEECARKTNLDHSVSADAVKFKQGLEANGLNAESFFGSLRKFQKTRPRLPKRGSRRLPPGQVGLGLDISMNRPEVLSRLQAIRTDNDVAKLAFYAYRDLTLTETAPFIWAVVNRNPVSIREAIHRFGEPCSTEVPQRLLQYIHKMRAESIYSDTGRLAQPDEVWNFGRGDGIEKSLLLANVLRYRFPKDALAIEVCQDSAVLHTPWIKYSFSSRKKLPKQTWVIPSHQAEN